MSNLDVEPDELTCSSAPSTQVEVSVLTPRSVPLGGPRAMTVRRTLPQRAKSLIGAWCFVDHFGPDPIAESGGMRVDGHPHTGLQTVSWLFSGEVEHRDTVGSHEYVRPGEVNLMTAGSGIAHSEHSTPETAVLHGAQLWVALPDGHRHTAPAFEHHAPQLIEVDDAQVLVFIGSLLGETSPVRTFTPLLGAEITLPPGARLRLDVDAGFEHGILVDTGMVTVADTELAAGTLGYLGIGADTLAVANTGEGSARILLLGGEPLGEEIVMWWNFIGRTHEEVAQYRAQWQAERADPGAVTQPRYGEFPAQWRETLPAPGLPNARLKPRH